MRLIRLLKHDLAREASEWVADEVITQSQAESICKRYGVDYQQSGRRTLGYNVLVGLGYLFLGLALITLIGANWEEIPRALRMWGLVALTVTTQVVALRRYLSGDRGGATGLFLLGNLFFGASIVLIAQIYHLGEHMPDGVLWWALGCLPFAVLLKNPWLALQTNVLALIWFFLEVSFGFYPALFPLFIVGSLWVLWRGRQSILLLLLLVASIGFWLEYSLAALWRDSGHFEFHVENLAVGAAMFILLYALSHWLGRQQSTVAKDYGAILAIWSLRFSLLFMLVMSFAGPWERLIYEDWIHLPSMFSVLGLFTLGALLLAHKAERLISTVGLLGFFWSSLLAVILATSAEQAIYFQLVYNFALIGLGVWLVVRGIHSGLSHYFFLGVLAILLTALMRYIDLIGDYIGASLIFMLFAMVLLGAARYWKKYQSGEAEA